MIRWLSVCLMVWVVGGIAAKPRLEKVVVYPSEAQLWYALDTQLAPGYHRLVFADLPHSVVRESVRWRVPKNVQLMEWSVKVVPTDPADVPPAVRAYYDSLMHYERLVDSFDRVKRHYRLLQKVLSANMDVKGREALLPEDVEDIFQYIDAKNRWILRRMDEAAEALERMEHHRDYWQKRWAEASRPYQNEGEVVVTVRVTSVRRRPFRIGLDFLVKNAAWHPEYRITAYPHKQMTTWMLMGNVEQTTGKDWSPDTLVLTNATPQQYLYVPRLTPWYLVVHEPKEGKVAARTFEAAVMEGAPPAAKRAVTESRQMLLHEFSVVRPPRIPSTGERIPIVLRLVSPQVAFEYRLYPSSNTAAILTALVENVDQYRLIKAPAKVFIGNRYNGRTHIDPFTTDGRLVVPLGGDDRVTVEKTLVRKQKRGPGISGTYTIEYRYQYTVTNHYNWEVKTVTYDRVPLSPDRRVKVNYRADGALVDDASGVIRWPATLGADARRKWTLEISVTYPKELQIYNLP